jgi:hypothetical protein
LDEAVGIGIGQGSRRILLTTEKMAVAAPIPRARIAMAVRLKAGLARRVRAA